MVCCSLTSAIGALVFSVSAVAAPPAPAFVRPELKTAAVTDGPAGLPGSVGVKVQVTTAGRAGAVSINLSTNPADDAAALASARRSTYVPARRDGRPVPAYAVFLIQFSATGRATFLPLAASDAARNAAYDALSRKQYAQAERGLVAYLNTVPDDSRVREVLAETYGFEGRSDDALAMFDRAGFVTPRERPYVASLYGRRALAEFDANRPAAAFADLDRATSVLALTPAQPRAAALGQIAAVYARGGRFDKAAALRATALGLDPATPVDEPIANGISRRVAAQTAANDNAGAVETLEAAAVLQPARAHAYLHEATLVLASAQAEGSAGWAAVRSEADKALALDGSDAMMAYIAAYALMETNDPATARTYLLRAQDALKNGATADDPALADKIAEALKQTAQGN